MKRLIVFFGVFGLLSSLTAESSFEVESGFSTVEVRLGREVTYSITIRKKDPGSELKLEAVSQPELPALNAMRVGRFQTSDQYLSSYGNLPIGVTLEYEMIPTQVGRIIIPSFSYDYMGEVIRIPASVINVRRPDYDLGSQEIKWLMLETGEIEESLWLGERVKTYVELYVFDALKGVTYREPVPVGNDFSLEAISPGPTERVETIGNYRYRVFRWPFTFSTVRSGKNEIGFKCEVNFRIPNDRVSFIRAARENSLEGLEEIDRLLQDSSEESLTVFTEIASPMVRALPESGAEENFGLGIGEFEVSDELGSNQLTSGTPVNYSVRVEGSGNIGILSAPELDLGSDWRVFPPEASFENDDYLGFEGVQVFNYVVIPLSSDVTSFPGYAYSHFDVVSDAYIVHEMGNINVDISGASVAGVETSDENQVVAVLTETDEKLSDQIYWYPGSEANLGKPFYQRLDFIALQVGLLAVYLFWFGLSWRRLRISKDDGFRSKVYRRRWVSKYLSMAKRAAKDEDSELFYEAAFLVFCALVGAEKGSNVEAITTEDVLSRIKGLKLNENSKRVIHSYLNLYESFRFSGSHPEAPPLAHEYSRLRSILGKLEKQILEPA